MLRTLLIVGITVLTAAVGEQGDPPVDERQAPPQKNQAPSPTPQPFAEPTLYLDALLAGEPVSPAVSVEVGTGIPADGLLRPVEYFKVLEKKIAALSARAQALNQELAVSDPDTVADPAPSKPEVPPPPDEAATDEERAAHRKIREEYAAALADWEKAARSHALKAAEQSQERNATHKRKNEELARLEAEIILTRLQARYIQSLVGVTKRLSFATLRSFELLGEPRHAIIAQSDKLVALGRTVAQASNRLVELHSAIEGGRLLGFVSQQKTLAAQLSRVAEQLAEQDKALSQLSDEWLELAQQQRDRGIETRREILRAAPNPKQQEVFDTMFGEAIERLRRQQSRLDRPDDGSLLDLASIATKIDQLVPHPEQVATLSAATDITRRAEELDAELSAAILNLRGLSYGWALAFDRELVNTLDRLVSDETRRLHNTLTKEILDAFWFEGQALGAQARTWFTDTKTALVRATTRPQTLSLGRWGQVALSVLLLFGMLAAGQGRRLAGTATRWMARRKMMRGRVGTLVRWANLLQAVAPVFWAVACGYLATRFWGPESAEAVLFSTFLKWLGLYFLGRQALLGLTRSVSRGRPALVEMSESRSELLRSTYGRMGLALTALFIIDEIAVATLGLSRLYVVIDLGMLAVLGAWSLWAASKWRAVLATAWIETSQDDDRGLAIAQWALSNRAGAILSPFLITALVIRFTFNLINRLLLKGGVIDYFRALKLRRQSRNADEPSAAIAALPDDYLLAFAAIANGTICSHKELTRPEVIDPIIERFSIWREERVDGSVVLTGDKGAGKSTILNVLKESLPDCEVSLHPWQNKTLDDNAVAKELSGVFGAPHASTVDELIATANEGPERVVLIDDAHHAFLRTIRGYRGFEALVRMVHGTTNKVFWVLSFNQYSWQFLSESHRGIPFFRHVVRLPPWTADEIQEVLTHRTRAVGYELEFDKALLTDDRSDSDFRLIESADGYFRLLAETSHGNPRVAIQYWLASLQPRGEKLLRAGLFRESTVKSITTLTEEILHVLAFICQHESLSPTDLMKALNVNADFAHFALQFLREAGVAETSPGTLERVTLGPKYYLSVLKTLRDKHLLFAG